MKNFNMKKIVLILSGITIICFLIAGLFFVFSYNSTYSSSKSGIWKQQTINEEKVYKIENIEDIFIETSSTDVNIIPVDSDEIKINLTGSGKGSSEKSLPKLFTEVKGNKLIIDVKSSGGFGFSIFDGDIRFGLSFFSGDINLDIYIPKKYKNNLDIDVSSADVIINDLEINNFNFDTSSGDLDIKSFKSNECTFKTSSGDLNLQSFKSNESTFKTSSGKINAEDFSGDLECVSSSGKIYFEYENFNNNVYIKSSSGDIKLKLPNDSGFHLKADTSSGDIVTDFPISLIGTIKDDYLEGTFGNGDNKIKIKTSSGDIELFQ